MARAEFHLELWIAFLAFLIGFTVGGLTMMHFLRV